MFFKDWRLLDQSPVDLLIEKEYVYYIHSRAWALKGLLGGTHSWIAFWSSEHNEWLVIELSDQETVEVQKGNIYWIRDSASYQEHSPIISNRIPNAKWFGTTPAIVGKCKNNISYKEFINVCKTYPIQNFRLIDQNCNTFTSFLISELQLNIRQPLQSIGFRSNRYWKKIKDHKYNAS
jgi:hypothetical protein